MYTILILPLAKQDIQEAAIWYNEKKKGLGLIFLRSVRKNVQYIVKNPFLFTNRYKNTYTAVIKDFPFMIHYQIEEKTKIVVLTAVFHTSLNPIVNWGKRSKK
jgi:hypothetical protein